MLGFGKKRQNVVQDPWMQKVQADLDMLLVPPNEDIVTHLGKDLVGIKLSEQAGNKKYVKIAIGNFGETTSVQLFQKLVKLPRMPNVIQPIRSAFINLLTIPSCPIVACWVVLSGKAGKEALSAFKAIVEADGDKDVKKLVDEMEDLTGMYMDIYSLKLGSKKNK